MKKGLLKIALLIATTIGISACGNNSSKVKRDPNSPMTYIDFNDVDNNGNYYDKITGNALFTKGNVSSVDGFEEKLLILMVKVH